MPCQDHQQLSSAFPVFPANFKSDTPYFHQALSEQNFQRIAQGLPVQTFSELSHADRSKVLAHAQGLKDADRIPKPRWRRSFFNLRSFLAKLLVLFFSLTLLAMSAFPQARFTHIIVVVQENRTIDNLFGGAVGLIPGADISPLGTSERLAASVELPHTHAAWLKNYEQGAWPTGSKRYVNPIDVQPYYQIAEQFGFGNAMFQTNQGPSFAAHQFLWAGTSEPSVGSNLLAAENPSGIPCGPNSTTQFIDPEGVMHLGSSCMDHGTIADLATSADLTWRNYAEASGIGVNLWNPADGIRHICMAGGQMTGAPQGKPVCTGASYTANVVHQPTQVLADIAAGDVANITLITPTDLTSDHPGTRGNGGPAWVASIVNAVESNPDLWPNTAIVILWDDWGGRYDHVAPMVNATGACIAYCYGGRVPFLFVSAYTAPIVSNQPCDFSCILLFVEHNFNLPLIGDGTCMDAYALGDLSEYFSAGEPRKPQFIHSRKLTKRELEATGAPDND